jgi:hypothetical protein
MKKKFENLYVDENFYKNKNRLLFDNILKNFNKKITNNYYKLKLFIKNNIELNFLFLTIFSFILFVQTSSVVNQIALISFAVISVLISINYYKLKKAIDDFYENEIF